MRNEQTTFDLIQEKQELDTFLSAISATEVESMIKENKEPTVLLSSEGSQVDATVTGEIADLIPPKDKEQLSVLAEGEQTLQQEIAVVGISSYEIQEKAKSEIEQIAVTSPAIEKEMAPLDEALPDHSPGASDENIEEKFIAQEKKEDILATVGILKDKKPGQEVAPPMHREMEATGVDHKEEVKDDEAFLPMTGQLSEKPDKQKDMQGAEQIKAKTTDSGMNIERDEKKAGTTRDSIPETERTMKIELPAALLEEEAEKVVSEKELRSEAQMSRLGSNWVRAAVLLVVFFLMILAYLWFNPATGQQTLQWISSNVPLVGQFVGVGKVPQESLSEKIRFINVGQRHYDNALLGKIRIVEGIAVNYAGYPVARIKVRAELYDNKNALLASQESYCGNVLSNDQLGSVNEEGIRSAMSTPEGSNLSNKKVPPMGNIPFMVVFTREPVGVSNVTIMLVGFEKAI